jgi:hypothetical protein
MITFDPINRLIIISIPITEISIQELIDSIRDWEDEFEALSYPQVANAYGKQDLGGGTKIGITLELINNWRIKFEDRLHAPWTICKILGGNIVAINDYENNPICPSNYVSVIISQSTSASIVYSGGSSLTSEEHNKLMAGAEEISVQTIKTETEKIPRILGLNQENYRITNPIYDSNNNLISTYLKIYRTKSDCDNDVNVYFTYKVTATYDAEGKILTYKVTKE